MNADLQDPPELIPDLLDRWRQGYDVICAQRIDDEGDSWLRRFGHQLFHRLISRTSRVELPLDAGDFRLLSRRAVDAMKQLKEQHRLTKGLFSWIGFRQVAVPYQSPPGLTGQSKIVDRKSWKGALSGVISFTTAPLRIATGLGMAVALLVFAYVALVAARSLIEGTPADAYPSLISMVLFLGGVQLICLGLMGEYLARLFDESKRRPLYLLDAHQPATSRRATLARQRKGQPS
jgi:glycosyltransferase involved in cell wall biosynthesis